MVDELDISRVILTNRQRGIKMEFYYKDRPCHQDRPMTIKVESRGILWNLMESRPVTIKVGFLLESTSLIMRYQSLTIR